MRHKTPYGITVISKVTPIQVVTPIKPNSEDGGLRIIHQIKQIIGCESLLGINRLYLLNYSRIIQFFNFLYAVILATITVYFMTTDKNDGASFTVVRVTFAIEYISLIILSVTTGRSSLKKFFADLSSFDHMLKISDDSNITCPVRRGWLWIGVNFLYSALEFILWYIFVNQIIDRAFVWTYITVMAHDLEHLFVCTLIRMILIRAIVIKAHVEKTFSRKTAKTKLTEAEALSNKAQLDISSLHKNYELLHKCAEELNSILSLPVLILLFCSGLSTTMLLKMLFTALQSIDDDKLEQRTVIIYCTSRCFKYTLMVIVPCYLSSVTTTQVTLIRTILHDAMNCVQIDKINRRRVKAFFQLTRENEFAYALWGVIRLNMSLPLSYLSLCTTYLVIIIQFSKFID